MSKLSIVLQNVVVLSACGDGNLLCDGLKNNAGWSVRLSVPLYPQWSEYLYQKLGQVLIWDVRQLLAMVLGNNQLRNMSVTVGEPPQDVRCPTACPLLSGLMSIKARVLSLSKSLIDGMSPG